MPSTPQPARDRRGHGRAAAIVLDVVVDGREVRRRISEDMADVLAAEDYGVAGGVGGGGSTARPSPTQVVTVSWPQDPLIQVSPRTPDRTVFECQRPGRRRGS